jgi:phage terminase large subunit-like protein
MVALVIASLPHSAPTSDWHLWVDGWAGGHDRRAGVRYGGSAGALAGFVGQVAIVGPVAVAAVGV